MRVITVFFLICLAASAAAQVTYEGCRDFRGILVASVLQPNLGDVAMATYAPNGWPVILYDPAVLSWMAPQTRLFFYAHECGHHALAHSIRNVPFAAEQEADCFGIRELMRNGRLRRSDLPVIQADIVRFGRGDWTHLPGPQRAINLTQCPGLP